MVQFSGGRSLGIDVATAGCKAAAFSLDGRALAQAYREYPTLHPQDGWAELDSRRVVALIRETIAEVAAATAGDPVTALCTSSLGEAVTPVSASGEILAGSILHMDVRGGGLLLAAVAALVLAARGAPAAEGLSDTELGASLR